MVTGFTDNVGFYLVLGSNRHGVFGEELADIRFDRGLEVYEVCILPEFFGIPGLPAFANTTSGNPHNKLPTASASFELGDWALDNFDPTYGKSRGGARLSCSLLELGHTDCLVQVSLLCRHPMSDSTI
jgi:hypothetical protein